MGSLALLPLGYALAGRWRKRSGRSTCCWSAASIGLGMLGLTLLPRETRELGQGGLEDSDEHDRSRRPESPR